MSSKKYGLLTFHSTHHALKAEKKFKNVGLEIMMIPIPREITANCGTGIKFNLSRLNEVKELVAESQIKIWGYYKVWQRESKKEIIKM